MRVLESLRERRGRPAAIQVDNGTEFTSRVVHQWAYRNQVVLHFIERGKSTQNGFIESFNGKFLDECLNQNWFVDLRHAREVIESWRVGYNTVRPHSSLGTDARRICRRQRLWKRRWLRHLAKRGAFSTFPQPRRHDPISTFAVEPKTLGASL